MITRCPKCHSEHIDTNNYARKTGSTIGTLAGAASVTISMLRGAELGGAAGTLAGPVGTALGTIAGAIMGGLIGGATGSAIGAKLGEMVDTNVLDNFECLDCHFKFSKAVSDSDPFSHSGN